MTPVTPGLVVPSGLDMGPLTLVMTSSFFAVLKYLRARKEPIIRIHPPKIDPIMIATFIRVNTIVRDTIVRFHIVSVKVRDSVIVLVEKG
jgi:hypothetical protein